VDHIFTWNVDFQVAGVWPLRILKAATYPRGGVDTSWHRSQPFLLIVRTGRIVTAESPR
jgi:hypothetical protein